MDTKFIPKWLNKTGVRDELMQTWEDAQKVNYDEVSKPE